MRRLRTALVALAMAPGMMLLGASPAQASASQDPTEHPPPGGILRNVYSDSAFCEQYGASGVQEGLWTSYICEPYESSPGHYLYFFWVFIGS